MTEVIDKYGNVDWSQGLAIFSPEPFSAHGHNRPMFAQRVSYEHPGYTEIQTTERANYELILRIDDQGIGLYSPDGETCIEVKGSDSLPLNGGWKVCYARCDQTGGMCMVDVYVFENGYCLTVNEECAVLHSSLMDWDYRDEGFPFIKGELVVLDFCG